VRNAAGLRFRHSNAKLDCAALYALPDLASSPLIDAARGFRLYLCRCRTWVQMNLEDALDDPDTDSLPFRMALPWRCDGHPLAELPHEFDGVLVTADNLPGLIADATRGSVPPGAYPFDRSRTGWVARMRVRLEGTPWVDVVDRAAAGAA
jgi:hypothetical protein